MMGADNMVIECDQCKKEFLIQSVEIKETSVEIEGKSLLLDYFVCPHCRAVYKVLLVEEAKYRELVDDLMAMEKRIRRRYGKKNVMLAQKLQSMALVKQNRIKAYVESVSKKYPGSFVVLATENNQQREQVKYLPREDVDMKGEK